ncbi:MAG: substrate-binding domain-containing protein [Sulfurimonas sp.]|nr:substrate-binding domain-containing protein [Sulfurimonas sp.]
MSQYKEGIHWQEVEPTLYSPIEQGVVLLSLAKDKKAYKLFYEFLFTSDAQKIFKKYGYISL